MNPPTSDELVGPPPHDLDQQWALKNFLGKSREQAIEMFKKIPVTEDFAYMASAGLCYYLPAALRYLESEDSRENWEFASGLMCSLSSQVSIMGLRGEPLPLIRQVADYLDANRQKFELGQEDLFDEYLALIRSV